jgi:hypothetical protein
VWHEEHRNRSRAIQGRDWRDLHRWLDQYAGLYCGWHRIVLHHQLGIKLAVQRFGEAAREAAELHVKDDFAGLAHVGAGKNLLVLPEGDDGRRVPDDPADVARYYSKRPNKGLACEIVEELRKLYGQDFGLADKWRLGL